MWNNGKMKYWNAGLNKKAYYIRPSSASMSSGIYPITYYSIFPEPIIPSFHYSNSEQSELNSYSTAFPRRVKVNSQQF
jgi:hypothetical protein